MCVNRAFADASRKDRTCVVRLHIVGSGGPEPAHERYGSSLILEIGAELLIIDCGPGTTYKMARMNIAPTQISYLFITHHHFDHNADFVSFALSRWDQLRGEEPPLRVYGPPPTRKFVEMLLGEDGAFFPDWCSRMKHPASLEVHRLRGESLPRRPPVVEAEDIGDGAVVESESWKVIVRSVHHVEPRLVSLSYRFETGERSVVFAGDCGYCDVLRELAKGADTLVIACTHFGALHLPPAITDVINGVPEVVEIAEGASVRRLVLTHATPGFAREKEKAIGKIARSFSGKIPFREELISVNLSQ